MVMIGPAPPAGSKVVAGRTIVPTRTIGPAPPAGSKVVAGRTIVPKRKTSSGGRRSNRQAGPTRATLEAEKKRKAKIIEKQEADNKARIKQEAQEAKIAKERQDERIRARTLAGQVDREFTGPGSFTKAVDVGEDRIQDFFFRFDAQGIQSAKAIGMSIPTTERFRKAQENLSFSGLSSTQIIKEEQISPGFRIGLSASERRQKTGQIIKGRFKEVGIGIVSAGAFVAEGTAGFASLFGTQLLTPEGESIQRKGIFGEGGKIGGRIQEISSSPSSTGKILGQALVGAPLVAAGATSIFGRSGQIGAKAALKEAAAGFTPLAIPAQTFGALETTAGVKALKFDVATLKGTTGDLTSRLSFGRGGQGSTLISKQVSTQIGGREFGVGVVDITAPKTTFRLGRFEEGLTSVRSETIFGSGQKGTSSLVSSKDGLGISSPLSGEGGVSQIFTRTKGQLSISETGGIDGFFKLGEQPFKQGSRIGTVSRKVDGVDIFASGRGRQFLKVRDSDISKVFRIPEINVKGFEVDVSSLGGTKGFIPSAGGSGFGTSTKQISAAISDITTISTKPLKGSTLPITTSIPKAELEFPSGAAQKFQQPQRIQQLTIEPVIIQKPPRIKQEPLIDIGSAIDITQEPISRSRGRSRQRPIQETLQIPKTDQFLNTIPDVAQRPRTRQKPRTGQIQGSVQEFLTPTPSVRGLTGRGFGDPVRGGFDLPSVSLGDFGFGRVPARPSKRKPGSIGPSLTGIAQFQIGGITGGPLPTIKDTGLIGLTPGQLRLVPKRKRKSKKKK